MSYEFYPTSLADAAFHRRIEERQAAEEATRLPVTITMVSGRAYNLNLSSRERSVLASTVQGGGFFHATPDLSINVSQVETVEVGR